MYPSSSTIPNYNSHLRYTPFDSQNTLPPQPRFGHVTHRYYYSLLTFTICRSLHIFNYETFTTIPYFVAYTALGFDSNSWVSTCPSDMHIHCPLATIHDQHTTSVCNTHITTSCTHLRFGGEIKPILFIHPFDDIPLCISKVPGDGSCQFYALTHCTTKDPHNLRIDIVRELLSNRDYYLPYITTNQDYTKVANSYLMKKKWGDQLTLAAAATVLETNIHVFTKKMKPIRFQPYLKPNCLTHTCIFYNGLNHYDALVPYAEPVITTPTTYPPPKSTQPSDNPHNSMMCDTIQIRNEPNTKHNLRIATLNICSLTGHLDYVCNLPFDIIFLQEVLVRLVDRRGIEIQLKTLGWNITWSHHVNDREVKTSTKNHYYCAQNQTLAIMARNPTNFITNPKCFTPDFDKLTTLGHAMYCFIPVEDGHSFIHLINYYGITGSRTNQQCKTKNNIYISHLFEFAAGLDTESAIIIAGDFNDDVFDNSTINGATETRIWAQPRQLFAEQNPENLKPTYSKHGSWNTTKDEIPST